jgi:Replication protein
MQLSKSPPYRNFFTNTNATQKSTRSVSVNHSQEADDLQRDRAEELRSLGRISDAHRVLVCDRWQCRLRSCPRCALQRANAYAAAAASAMRSMEHKQWFTFTVTVKKGSTHKLAQAICKLRDSFNTLRRMPPLCRADRLIGSLEVRATNDGHLWPVPVNEFETLTS